MAEVEDQNMTEVEEETEAMDLAEDGTVVNGKDEVSATTHATTIMRKDRFFFFQIFSKKYSHLEKGIRLFLQIFL